MLKYLFAGIFLLLLVGGALYLARPDSSGASLSLTEARAIATASSSRCIQKGEVGESGVYNENTKTWWLDFTPKSEYVQQGCSPACVIETLSKQADINWRCTGVQTKATYEDMLRVDMPLLNSEVTNPITITGEARGGWYFEASFPIKILDARGKIIAEAPAQAQGDWMTQEYVPFSATIAFEADTATGTVVLQNDNPSGEPENQKELQIPVSFSNAFSRVGNVTRNNPGQKPNVWFFTYEKPGSPAISLELDLNSAQTPLAELSQGDRVRVTGTLRNSTLVVRNIAPLPIGDIPVTLYFYDPSRDQGPGGAQCSSQGLIAVDRVLPKTTTPLTDAIRLLIKGEISAEEKARGITTEFPLSGVTLASASIAQGVATLTFNDPQNKLSGGSCRISVLRAQIETTAKQFPTVRTVMFSPNEILQP